MERPLLWGRFFMRSQTELNPRMNELLNKKSHSGEGRNPGFVVSTNGRNLEGTGFRTSVGLTVGLNLIVFFLVQRLMFDVRRSVFCP